MYQDYFGLSEKPFHLTPNPRFLFLSKNHREVFAHLLYGIRQRVGFVEVTGEVGTGKTTILRTLFTELGGHEYRLAVIFNPSLTAAEMLSAVGREFGLQTAGLSSGELLAALNDFLLAENALGRTVVLVIDEAQNLAPDVLEQIRLLSNLETESEKLIQIILVGQPELGKLLARPDLRQLSQRISVRYHLRPLDEEDTRAYIEHRLAIAGWKGGRLFEPAALQRIYRLSGGLPRLINVYSDRALLAAYAADRREVTSELVAQAAAELRRSQTEPRLIRLRRWWLPGSVGLLLVVLGLWVGRNNTVSLAEPPAVQAAVTMAAPAAAQVGEDGARSAVDTLFSRWGVSGLKRGEPIATGHDLAAAADVRGLQLLRLRGDLMHLMRLDSPALLELKPEAGLPRYLAVLSASGDRWLVAPPVAGEEWLDASALVKLWDGTAYLPWKNILGLATKGVLTEADEVAGLQRLLQESRLYGGPISGELDGPSQQSIRLVQRLRGLKIDGLAGPETLLVLYQESGQPGIPRLSAVEAGR